jgi:hypothetical protein
MGDEWWMINVGNRGPVRLCVVGVRLLSLFAGLDPKSGINTATGFPCANPTVAMESKMATLLALLAVSQIDNSNGCTQAISIAISPKKKFEKKDPQKISQFSKFILQYH